MFFQSLLLCPPFGALPTYMQQVAGNPTESPFCALSNIFDDTMISELLFISQLPARNSPCLAHVWPMSGGVPRASPVIHACCIAL